MRALAPPLLQHLSLGHAHESCAPQVSRWVSQMVAVSPRVGVETSCVAAVAILADTATSPPKIAQAHRLFQAVFLANSLAIHRKFERTGRFHVGPLARTPGHGHRAQRLFRRDCAMRTTQTPLPACTKVLHNYSNKVLFKQDRLASFLATGGPKSSPND
jgi:hypothetical protein